MGSSSHTGAHLLKYTEMGKTRITSEQEKEVVKLYRKGGCSINSIMEQTDIRSKQTIYRILSSYNIRKIRRKSEGTASRVNLILDEEAARIIEAAKPRNISEFICEMIKKGSRL